MQAAELATLSEILSGVIRKAVSKAKDEIREEFRLEMDARIAALPVPEKGKDFDLDQVRGLVAEAVAELPTPTDGKDADVAVIFRHVEETVQRQIANLPKPEDGKDADMDAVFRRIDERVAAIPQPEPIDKAAIVAEIQSQIRVPEDGKSVDPEEVVRLVEEKAAQRDYVELRKVADEWTNEWREKFIRSEYVANEIQNAAAIAVEQLPKPLDGKNVDPKDVETMVQRAIEALPKPKDGESVHPDTVRVMVLDEVRKAVAEIPKVKDGEPGRDALAIEILPAIDPSKEYPRGTFAKDKNGLWRREATGWECIVSGIQGFEITQSEDPRSFVFTVRSSDGNTIEKQFNIPVMIYRYLHDKEQSYKVGDTVTYDGNIWHSNVDNPTTLPGTSKEWTLAVRAGRPGRDLRPEEPRQHTPVQLGNGKKK